MNCIDTRHNPKRDCWKTTPYISPVQLIAMRKAQERRRLDYQRRCDERRQQLFNKLKTKGNTMPKNKTFYIISSITREESYQRLHKNKKFDTEKGAAEMAESIVVQRQRDGASALQFYVLKAVSVIGVKQITPPIETVKLK